MDCFDKKQPNKKFPRFKKKGQGDSFRSEHAIAQPIHNSKSIVGIDVGIARFATLSTGNFFPARNYFRKLASKLSRAQKALSRKIKFSNNWHKQKKKIQNIHAKIANSRRDRLHWCSHQISQNHAIIVMENLKVSNMSKSAKGDMDTPGKCVKAKSGLNKSILDQGWYEFRSQLEYKQRWRGGEVLVVNPKNTSRTCPNTACRHTSKANRKSQSEFKCECCGYTNNADVVGAINVLRAGHAQLACGDIESISNQAQEPLKNIA